MRIQHNIMAMNAYRNYNTNTSALSKNLEKLSSGYKINRAGDDAAGLAISEKMRAQITGLNAAQKNVKDGISLVKTAEGAMQEIQDMLNRMDYLATQSANGTYDNEVDRKNLQKEVDALKQEIDRIADSANFNGIKLLDGSLDADAVKAENDSNAAAAANAGWVNKTVSPVTDAIVAKDPKALNFEVDLSNLSITFKGAGAGNASATRTATITVAGHTLTIKQTVAASSADLTVTGSDLLAKIDTTTIGTGANAKTIGGAKFDVKVDGAKITFAMQTDAANIDAYTKTTALDANVTITASNGVMDKGFTTAVNITQAYEKGGKMQHAQGSFTISGIMVKDGAQLKVGDQTYTFKVGKNGKGAGGTVIDLTDVEEGASNIATLAAIRLSAKQNPGSKYTLTANGQNGSIKLTTKDGFDYSSIDLVGTSTTTVNDASWLTGSGTSAVSAIQYRAKAPEAAKSSKAGKLTLQIGDDAEDHNRLDVNVGDMHCKALGIGSKDSGIDISTPDGAKAAIATIKNAINTVSSVRGDLGAVQNRLEHTANNLSVMAENIQDAESTIRDTDVAEEMMAYTKNNILIQSAQAMLAQANAVPQGVLQLLG